MEMNLTQIVFTVWCRTEDSEQVLSEYGENFFSSPNVELYEPFDPVVTSAPYEAREIPEVVELFDNENQE